jgi:hypothetical protein
VRAARRGGLACLAEQGPDVLCLQEVRASGTQLASVNGGRASRVRFELSSLADTTRLRVRHDGLQEGSSFLAVFTEGWPMMLASLKSLLETGSALQFR